MSKTSVSVKHKSIITPAQETPRRSQWLSSLDWMVLLPFRHTVTIFIYRPNVNNDTNTTLPKFFDANIMKTALSQVLVPFYPLAGRLKRDEEGRLEIDCNGEGVLFVEAEATQTLDEVGALTPDAEPRKWLAPTCDYSKGVSSFPLLMVQLTRFSCGSVALGLAQHHQYGDGTAYHIFINSWARLAQGYQLDNHHLPFHDRTPFLIPRNPPRVNFSNFIKTEYGPPQGLIGDNPQLKMVNEKSPTTTSVFKLSKDQISDLKNKAQEQDISVSGYRFTTYEVVSAHVWRCACKARELDNNQEVRLFIPTNGRQRLKQPALPQEFCGNATFYPACIAQASEITSNTLEHVASKIHETIMRANNEEYLRSTIDYLETHPNKESLIRGSQKLMCPNIHINSWVKLPYDKADFGWGSPIYGGTGGIGYEGQAIITSTLNGDGGLLLSIKLFTIHMPSFAKYFYDF